MHSTGKSSLKSFVLLALTILVPLCVLTCFAISAVLRDRSQALDQARREARILAPRLLKLVRQDLETFLKQTAETLRNSPIIGSNGFAIPPATSAILAHVAFQEPGAWLSPVFYPTVPKAPPWFEVLSIEQRSLLFAAEGAGARDPTGPSSRQAWERFVSVAPPEARPYGTLGIILSGDRAERAEELARFVPEVAGLASTPSGLPILSTALLELLRFRAQETNAVVPTQALLQGAERVVRDGPSYLTPSILRQLQSLEPLFNQAEGLRFRELLTYWARQERARHLAPLWLDQQLAKTPPHSLWIHETPADVRVLALLVPAVRAGGLTHVAFLDPVALREVAVSSLRELAGLMPAYALPRVHLLGERMDPPSGSEAHLGEFAELAREEGALAVSGMALTLGLEMGLVDQSLLYRHQNQRAWLLGSVVGAAALAALAGLWALWRAFERQRELFQAQADFIASVSHELRTPIAAMSLMAENLAGNDLLPADRRRDYHRLLVQECRRLASLLENVLSLARIERSSSRRTLEPINLKALVASVCQSMQGPALHLNVRLVSRLPEVAEVEIRGDSPALERALFNLIDNALKHSPAGSEVLVLLREEPDGVSLCVEDQGSGIPLEDQVRVFDRFYRRGSELRRETQGIGIGLTLVKRIAEDHGGGIELESRPGSGCLFTLRIPKERTP